MILFKAVHVPLILADVKTQTRRLWPHGCRAKAGSVHWAQTKMLDPDSRFARLRILRVWQERLGGITQADSWAEGYPNAHEYLKAFHEINRVPLIAEKRVAVENTIVWVVSFERAHGGSK